VGHLSSNATTLMVYFGPPEAGFFYAMATLVFLSDAPHRIAKPTLP